VNSPRLCSLFLPVSAGPFYASDSDHAAASVILILYKTDTDRIVWLMLITSIAHDFCNRHIFQVGDFNHVAGLGTVDKLPVADINAHVGHRAVEADDVAHAYIA